MLPADSQPCSTPQITRRVALQLGASAGIAAAAAPYVARLGALGGAFGLGDAQLAMHPILDWPVPPMVTRAQWGANEALRKPGRIYDTPVTKIVVHHTGTPNDISNYAGLCRGILANETAGEYIDVAYNWLIDPDGRIYEGRWAQDYPAGAPHTGEHNGANIRGGHAIYHNAHTIGIALMGTYDTINPPPAMVEALITLLAWKCARWGIDPMGHGPFVATNGAHEDLFNICGHRDTSATDCPGQRTEPMLPALRTRVAARISGAGYWIASTTGPVMSFGGVVAAGNAGSFRPSSPLAGIAGHPSGVGYWLAAADGSVYGFNGTRFFGSMHKQRLAAPIIGIAATPTGKGYWLVAGDGGIFGFGDAKFFGSTGGIKLNRPVVSMAARPQGDGYWMIAEDGGVFGFGKAPFRGAGTSATNHAPCVAMLPSTTGNGYVMLRRDGAISAFGDAPNLGSATGRIVGPAVGIAGRLKPL